MLSYKLKALFSGSETDSPAPRPERLRRTLATLLLATSGLSVVGALALPAAVASASTAPTTVTFSTPGASTWTVPSDVIGSITITALGGGGGQGSPWDTFAGGPGGAGALMSVSLSAPAGTSFDVYVGGSGSGAGNPAGGAGGSNGYTAGSGGAGGSGSVAAAGGGGGAFSGVVSPTACTSGPSNFCLIAGGGGGGSGASSGGNGVAGGAGGYPDGAQGGSTTSTSGSGGTQGSISAGGAGTAAYTGSTGIEFPGGGGGGGGYSGGGGGDGGVAGGGGGGSYADLTDGGSLTSASVGTNESANGYVTITYTLAVPPTITSPQTSATFAEGSSGTYSFSATGTPTPTFTESGALPSGVSLSSSGVLSGTPTQDGAYPVTVTASNGYSPNATQSFTLYVDAPPSISEPSSSATVIASQSMTPVDFTATGYPAPTFSETGTLPTGASLSSSGVLSGTPTEGGSFTVTVTATNSSGSSSTSFTLVVNESPSITSAATSTFSVGTAGSFTVQASGYPTPTLSLSSSSTLPKGLSFSAGTGGTAAISGTPASGTGGSYQLGISASSSAGSAAQTLDLVIDSTASFTSPATIDVDAGSTVSFQVTTTGGYPVPSLTATASSLPTGLTFTDQGNGTALLTGMVSTSAEGNFTPTFTATNSTGIVNLAATLVVHAPGTTITNCPAGDACGTSTSQPVAPQITSKPSTSFFLGANGSYEIVATGTPTPAFVEAGALPGGVTLSSSGVLSGTPTTPGVFTFTVTATNGVLPDATQTFTLTVTAPPTGGGGGAGGGPTPIPVPVPSSGPTPSPPQLGGGQGTGAGTVTFAEGTGGSFQIPVSGSPTPTCALASGSLPPGLTLSQGCLVSGSPTLGGTFTFTVKASNASGSTNETLTLTVQPPKVVVVPPSGPDYHFVGVLSGALRYRVSSPASLRGTHVATSGKVLQSLGSDFGFDGRGGIGRVHLILQRDVRTVQVRQSVQGHQRLVRRRIASYAGVLVLIEPEHHGVLVFRQFTGVALRGKTVHAVAIGRLGVAKRIRVRVKLHGRERLVWRLRRIERPLRFAFQVSPSTS